MQKIYIQNKKLQLFYSLYKNNKTFDLSRMSSLPNNFNPSDYQFLIKSLTEGNYVTKAQSLKRFNTLVTTDKKQFAIYAKRIVLAIQDLMFQSKEDINLLAGNLTLEIINLNPRQIQYYIRSKLLKCMVKNLGDQKPQIRKTSHYCLLAYVKTYKSFEQIMQVYLTVGINSQEWQLRQKAVNSMQSILIMEMKYLNWGSNQFKRVFQTLLAKLKDQNAHVQKASQQCLLSLCKMEQLRAFSKKLIPQHFQIIKNFCQQHLQNGNLQEIKLDIQQKKSMSPLRLLHEKQQSTKNLSNAGSSMFNLEKIRMAHESSQKRAIINRIEEIRRNNSNAHTPKIQKQELDNLRKAQSVVIVNHMKQMKKKAVQRQKTAQIKLEPIKKEPIQKQISSIKIQKTQNIVSKKIIQDLKNDKDWKVRLQAIEELHSKYQNNKQLFDIDSITKIYIPILVKLLGDGNFKVALISLKIIEDIILMPHMNLQSVVPHLMERLSDNKIALRQNISKLIRSQYIRTKQNIWIQGLLNQLKKANNSNTKQQILSILSKFYEDRHCQSYSVSKVIESICPLMQDLKTKIKIKTLDLLVLVTLRSHGREQIKNMLMGKLNQVYYEMYSEKLNKEIKNKQKQASANVSTDQSIPVSSVRTTRATTLLNKRYGKVTGNTTSASLQRDKLARLDPNDTVRTSSFLEKSSRRDSQNRKSEELQNSNSKISLHDPDSSPSKVSDRKKSFIKSFRKKTHRTTDYKSTNYSQQEYQPFNDPQKQLKNILTEIKSDDWEISYQALSKTRRIIAHHKQSLTPPVIKAIIPQIMRLVQNLRSSLSKNAVLTLNDLALKLKRGLDSQIELIFNKLIKKSLDTNSFISEEVKKVIVSVCSNSNQTKVVSLLTATHTSRAIPIKQVVAHILENVTFLPKFYDKQLEKIVIILNNFMSQGSLEIRQKAKSILSEILVSQKGKQVMRLISAQHLGKLKRQNQQKIPQLKVVQKIQKNNQGQSQKKQNEEQLNQLYQNKKKKKQKINVFPEEFNRIQGLLQKCQSSDWKVRSQSMSEINQIYMNYIQQAGQHRLNIKFIDVLSKQIGDPNVKVATNALRIFKNLIMTLPSLVENNLSVVLNELFNCFASQKLQVKQLSQEFFDQVCVGIENWMLLQHMCNGILYGVQKSKALILEKLSNIVNSALKAKPNIFQKNVYPMINKIADQGKPQFLVPLKHLILIIYEEVGQTCMDYLKVKAKQLIKS